MKTRKSGKET